MNPFFLFFCRQKEKEKCKGVLKLTQCGSLFTLDFRILKPIFPLTFLTNFNPFEIMNPF
jgi:hypothetical protein